jgi:UDP-N-acetylglucosamine acyltransferase
MMADGNPATTRALNKEGLKRNEVSAESQAALKQAHRIIFRGDLTLANSIEKAIEEVETSREVEHLLNFLQSSQRGIAR